MKTICKFLIVILFFSIATVYADTIKDPRLDVVIKKKLYDSNPSWPIPVEDLEKLTELYVRGGSIHGWAVDLTGLEYCTNLKLLGLGGNEITDISPLLSLPGISEDDSRELVLVLVRLTNNPLLSRDSILTYIPALQKRGVTVDWSLD